MKGSYKIVVQNSTLRYEFEIRRNITIIKGNSATGKTTLIEMIGEFYENGTASGVELHCEKNCSVLSGRNWKAVLTGMQEEIVFIDEGNEFVHSTEFARAAQESDNYYVIVTREGLVNFPYSIEEIYGIRESGKYVSLKQTYNELYQIYGKQNIQEVVRPSEVIVEDSNAGYEFYKGVSEGKDYSVISSQGKSNIFEKVLQNIEEEKILVIADGAAFGSEMDRIVKLMQGRTNIILYLPESFEWLILKSDVLDNKEVRKILDQPSQYIDSRKFFSWERYFTALLIAKTEKSYLNYTKRKLNPVYLQENEKKKICNQIGGIIL